MIDTRELILVRSLAVLTQVAYELSPGVATIIRNRIPLREEQRPAFILLDGSERTVTQASGNKRNQSAPQIMSLEPQMWAALRVREPARANELGPELSEYRNTIWSAVKKDEELWNLVGTNGAIYYLGCTTDMQSGSSMEGQIQMNFAFHYVLNPLDLN